MISIGLDVGKEHDPAALAVLHAVGLRPESHRPHWHVLTLANIALGTPYQQLAAALVNLGLDYETAGYPTVATIDATGVGAAVLELARSAAAEAAAAGGPALHIVGITIGAGRTLTHQGGGDLVVGKHRLTEVLQVAFQQRGLTFVDPEDAELLRPQLERFVRKPGANGYQRHEAATGHDDLILALELPLWTGDSMYDQHAGVSP